MQSENSERLGYPILEAARLLGVGRSTIYNLMRDGELETYRIGDRRLVTRRALVSFVSRKVAESKAQEAAA